MNGAMLRVFLLLMFCVQAAFGTSLRPLELRQVSSHLTVAVTHRGKPIAGIEVEVAPEGSADPILTKTTDANGTVLIDGLMAGRYFLTASHEGFDVGKEWIEVATVTNAKAKRRLKLQWADWSYQTRRVAGTLTGFVPGKSLYGDADVTRQVIDVMPNAKNDSLPLQLKDTGSGVDFELADK